MLRPTSPSPPSGMTRRPLRGQRRRCAELGVRMAHAAGVLQKCGGDEVVPQLRDLLVGGRDSAAPGRPGWAGRPAARAPPSPSPPPGRGS